MKTVAIVIARLGSSRLPGKVLFDLSGLPVLAWVLRAPHVTPSVDETWVATSILAQDDPIADYCREQDIPFFRGSETDVLSRFYECAVVAKADVVVRLTADCCFADPFLIEQVIQLRSKTDADYANNVWPPTFGDGLDTEVMTFAALETAHNEAVLPSDRECVTTFIMRNRDRFKSETLINPLPGGHRDRFVLDTTDDLNLCREIAKRLSRNWSGSHLDIIRILDNEPELRKISKSPRNERYYESIAVEESPPPVFTRSNALLKRARKIIPLGAQTFSKSFIQYPIDHAPLFVTHGQGAYIYDVDGNQLVDLVSGLLPVILGYHDSDVDEAIRRQLVNGISFSTSTALEADLADILCELIPCAEMVRLGKNGSDSTNCAVRLARAYTGREVILSSGYHGWHEWSLWNTERSRGVPSQSTAHFLYGDRESVTDMQPHHVAGIIIEPENDPEFLQWLRDYCDMHGIVLIFDEIITGFRWAMGGAQEYFGVTPDLATFGKAMGNGMPISAIVGKREIMKLCEPPNNIFYSGTFQGETLSIAAAIACINKLVEFDVPKTLNERGIGLSVAIRSMIRKAGLTCIDFYGHHAMTRLKFSAQEGATADQIKTLFLKSMIQNGVLIIGSHNLSFSHREPELKRVFQTYERTINLIKETLENGTIAKELGNIPVIGPASVRI